MDGFTGPGIPQIHGVVPGAGGDDATVRRPCDQPDVPRVALRRPLAGNQHQQAKEDQEAFHFFHFEFKGAGCLCRAGVGRLPAGESLPNICLAYAFLRTFREATFRSP